LALNLTEHPIHDIIPQKNITNFTTKHPTQFMHPAGNSLLSPGWEVKMKKAPFQDWNIPAILIILSWCTETPAMASGATWHGNCSHRVWKL